ncbi:MAG: Cobalamin biosynthesis protein CbiM [Caldanaerobacter subterraneus]|uniref:Cobalamin biosynthesis protein CbiM n=3 Tax=Caldanaerobacter subterraneus TaxID=911092 RepID=Q8RD04_CALS4|nr:MULTISPECIES: cobalt transporter CbiM [Caldanaerobacter]AAM23545.1 Cobalamin biosynthesis protein CbiM [Caldanaerobacter subterraneus subsp. tengcongensis MB4]KUK07971.1 MAG: Cobalamin biosynthesis protein CbiM [Caldanaerobacter subterraneus]MDI3518160.1 cobalt/nickel transport system permease protein [Caldanaerobacter sp.]HBT48562.1 cobalamin biosynthesis protein CbiM [Caldanaerobacter subterraneus]
MHIPDGYLSPQTCAVMGAAMVPVLYKSVKEVNKELDKKDIPTMAIGSAFSFTVMMFNVPIPGGTTAHAIGSTLLAIVLGPWAAVISVTVALIIQALLFGDGGVLALGANTFNMAFLAPFVGYGVYKLMMRLKLKKVLSSAIGAYAGINAAAFATAVELGIQPMLFHTATGKALYFPYGLNISIPAMMFAHLTVAGFVEAIVTALVIYYLEKVGEDNILYQYSYRLRGEKR